MSKIKTSLFQRLSDWFRSKDRKYWKGFIIHWVVALALIIFSVWLNGWLVHKQYWLDLRYPIYDRVTGNMARPAYNRRTIVVMIGDDEYWKGKPAGRVPLKRSYLAELLKAVRAANPEVIAFDFRLRAPTTDGSPVPYNDYQAETQEFIDALKEASNGSTTIVLPKSLGIDGGGFILERDIYDGQIDTVGGKIRTGYIEFDDDRRRVPLELKLKDGTLVDSFALAIVRAAEGRPPLPSHDNNSMPYGSFMRPEEIKHFSASQVLSGDQSVLNELAHKIVIIGGSWHTFAYKRGHPVDNHNTPVGHIPGAYIHANYVESLISSRVSAPLDERVNISIEIVFSLIVAVILFVPIKARWKFLFVALIAAGLVLLSFLSWQILGRYFDFFIPMVLLGGHIIVEHWIHLRKEVRKLREMVSNKHSGEVAATAAQTLPNRGTA